MTDQQDINVTLSDGQVRLSGCVSHHYVREAAFRIANSTQGVKNVVNEIEIA